MRFLGYGIGHKGPTKNTVSLQNEDQGNHTALGLHRAAPALSCTGHIFQPSISSIKGAASEAPENEDGDDDGDDEDNEDEDENNPNISRDGSDVDSEIESGDEQDENL